MRSSFLKIRLKFQNLPTFSFLVYQVVYLASGMVECMNQKKGGLEKKQREDLY